MQLIGGEQLLESEPKMTIPSPRFQGREMLGKCRRPTEEGISNQNDAGIVCVSREWKLSSDKTNANASQLVHANSRWSSPREDAQNNAKTTRLLHSAQTSRCAGPSERPKSVGQQRPTTSLTRTSSSQPRKFGTQSARRQQQTVIRKVFQGFVDYDGGRKEKRTDNDVPPSSCRKPNCRTTDNGLPVPSIVTSEDASEDDEDSHSKFRLDAINRYSTAFGLRCERISKERGNIVRGRIVEWGDANGVSCPNRKPSSRTNPSTRNKELDAGGVKLQTKDNAIEEALGDGSRYVAGHGADVADDSGDRVVLRQTILERREAEEADDGDAKNERIVAWLLGLRYDQTERLPSPDISEEMPLQTDTAIHIVYDGD